jgi:MSHA biogenesis protein MshP
MIRPAHRRGIDVRGRGFALVPALFLVVVLGLLAVVGVRVGVGQQQTVTMGLMQARALAAARAGVEWGAYQARAPVPSCAPTTTLTLTEAALSGFTVVVTCASNSFTNGSTTSHSYALTATATTGTYGQPGYVRRVMSGTFTDAT